MRGRARFTRVAAALTASVAAACSRGAPNVAPTPSGRFEFVAETRADSAIEGRFAGVASLDGTWLTVTVPKAVITVPPGPAQNWRNLTIRAFLATDYRLGDWKAVAQSRPVNVFRFLNFTGRNDRDRRTIPLDVPLTFLVPIPPGASLATSRLAFEMEWVFIFDSYGETDSRIAFSGPITLAGPVR